MFRIRIRRRMPSSGATFCSLLVGFLLRLGCVDLEGSDAVRAIHIIRSARLLATLPTFFSGSDAATILRAFSQSLGKPVPTAKTGGGLGLVGVDRSCDGRFVFSR